MMASTLMMASCKSEIVESANTPMDALRASNLLGQWRLKSYSNGQVSKYDVSLEFKMEEGKIKMNGQSSVNFYSADAEIDETNKTLKVLVLGTTKIAGTPEANEFEMAYYENLKNIERYDFKDKNTLVFYLAGASKETMYFEKK